MILGGNSKAITARSDGSSSWGAEVWREQTTLGEVAAPELEALSGRVALRTRGRVWAGPPTLAARTSDGAPRTAAWLQEAEEAAARWTARVRSARLSSCLRMRTGRRRLAGWAGQLHRCGRHPQRRLPATLLRSCDRKRTSFDVRRKALKWLPLSRFEFDAARGPLGLVLKAAMVLRSTIGAFVSSSVLFCGIARGQELGTSGDAVFGAERLFGIRGERADFDREAPLMDTELESTTISFGAANSVLAHNVPRLSFDYLVTDKVSLGGALAYSSSEIDVSGPGGPLRLSSETTSFLFGGRVGYLHMLGRVLGIWPRAGLIYHSTSVEDTYDVADLGLNLEFMIPIVVTPHFGFLPGLTFDQSLMGKVNPPGDDNNFDHTYRSIAAQLGLFGWI